jgi:hypothetical protein
MVSWDFVFIYHLDCLAVLGISITIEQGNLCS